MSMIGSIALAEWRVQIRRPILPLAMVAVLAIAAAETLPTAANLQRLTFLPVSAYGARRLFDTGIPLLGLVAAFLTAGRMPEDRRTGMDAILCTTSGFSPGAYVLGKFLGSLLAFSMAVPLLLLVGIGGRLALFPETLLLRPYLKAALLLGLLPVAFLTALMLAAGNWVGPRVASIAAVLYLLWSQGFPAADSQGVTALYRFMGNLGSLIWAYPDHPGDVARITAGWQTAVLDVGVAGLALLLVTRYWRRRLMRGRSA